MQDFPCPLPTAHLFFFHVLLLSSLQFCLTPLPPTYFLHPRPSSTPSILFPPPTRFTYSSHTIYFHNLLLSSQYQLPVRSIPSFHNLLLVHVSIARFNGLLCGLLPPSNAKTQRQPSSTPDVGFPCLLQVLIPKLSCTPFSFSTRLLRTLTSSNITEKQS